MKPYESIIHAYALEPLPEEGGYFKRVYTHEQSLSQAGRSLASAIYFLITKEQFSALHRLEADELFHFYQGCPVEMLQLSPDGSGSGFVLGNNFEQGQRPMQLVRGGTWQGVRLIDEAPEDAFAFFGVSVHPGFVWDDFELGKRAELQAQYPDFSDTIAKLTRG